MRYKKPNKVKVAMPKETSGKGSEIKARLKGESMLPFLKNGQTLLFRPAEAESIAVGNIVLYHENDKVISHRVFRKGKGFIQTKADASVYADSPITSDRLIGKVVAVEKDGRVSRLDNIAGLICGLLISRISLITSRFQFIIKKLCKNNCC